MSNPVFDLIGKSYADIKEEKVEVGVSSKNEVIVLENESFDYTSIDVDIADFLKEREVEIKNIFAKAYTDLGKVLADAQERLSGSNQYDGLFYKWFTSLGFKKDKVYSLISRYKLLIGNSDKQDLIEKLPLSLSYEIAKESCPEDLKEKVLNGEIKSLKEFREEKNKSLDNNIELAEVVISDSELTSEIAKVDRSYSTLVRVYEEGSNKLSNKEKVEVYNELKNIEKRVNKLLRSMEGK